jgi:hypothetical protein
LHPTLNVENQVSVFMYPSDRVAQLHPESPGSPFIAFNDLQGYGGDILIRLHTGQIYHQRCINFIVKRTFPSVGCDKEEDFNS